MYSTNKQTKKQRYQEEIIMTITMTTEKKATRWMNKAHEEVRNYQKALALLGKESNPEIRALHARPVYQTMFYGNQLSNTDEVI